MTDGETGSRVSAILEKNEGNGPGTTVEALASMMPVEPGRKPTRASSAEYAFRMARRSFVAGERIDMQGLATQLGVDRTTLFRWVGNRDQLLTDILTSLASATFRDINAAIEERGAARIVRAAELYAQTLISSKYYRTFLHRDPERALRLISTKASPLQRQIVTFFEQALNDEADAGQLGHSLSMHDLAYLIVRVMESFLYSDLITGEQPDAGKVRSAVAALLGCPDL
ncbi:QsdR family transcriptional regulator [Paenarthrobacter aurescens]|uniref:QsdR family transcriptional regulator n=1 Tax=Paenarthrobacter aurescens TaxID=43663 RepID=UPI0035E79BBD